MKHISVGFDRICDTPVPEHGGYMSDAEWRKLPECPICYSNYTAKVTTEAQPEEVVVSTKRIKVLRDYLPIV